MPDATAQSEARPKSVTVTYNGSDGEFRFRPHEKVRVLLDQAIGHFHVASNPHLMGLFTEGNVELQDALSLEEAGIRPGQLLVLRVSAARGGDGRRSA